MNCATRSLEPHLWKKTQDGRWETGDAGRETGDAGRETGDAGRETGDAGRGTGETDAAERQAPGGCNLHNRLQVKVVRAAGGGKAP